MPKPTLVLVPGSWHRPSCFSLLIPHLERQGYSVVGLSLPSVGTTPGKAATFEDDCTALREAIGKVNGDVVVICHSYGGAVTTQALKGLNHKVKVIVYLCAYMLGEHVCISDTIVKRASWLDPQGDVAYVKNPETNFYEGFPHELKETLSSEISTQSLSVYAAKMTYTAWKHIPTTYVICSEDDVIPALLQEKFAVQATDGKEGRVKVERMQANHWPFVHMPEETAYIIMRAVKAAESPAISGRL